MTYYRATGPGDFSYIGSDRDNVIGKAGDRWSMHDDGPVQVHAITRLETLLIWMDGQPWPRPKKKEATMSPIEEFI